MTGEITNCSAACTRLQSLINAGLANCWTNARQQLNAALSDINDTICSELCVRDATEFSTANPSNFDSLWGSTLPVFPCDCLFLYVIQGNAVWFKRSDTVGGWSLLTAAPQASIVHTSGDNWIYNNVTLQVTTGDALVGSERVNANLTNNPSYTRALNTVIDFDAAMELYVPGTPGDGSTRTLEFTAKRNGGAYEKKLHLSYNDVRAGLVSASGGTGTYRRQDVVKVPPAGALVLSSKANFLNTVSPADSFIVVNTTRINTSGVTE